MLDEIKALLKKPILWITMIGIALVPALYNVIFLGSMWDPYGNVSKLPVAVVNQDQVSGYQGNTLAIGQNMVDSMSKNKELDYHFVSQKKAEKGLKSGDYYMMILLPDNLSAKASSILSQNPERLEITYQTSKGHSFVASKMGESAMKSLQASVSKNISETYTDAIFKSMTDLKKGLGSAASAGTTLSNGSLTLAAGGQQLTTGLGALSSGASTLTQGAGTYTAGVSTYTSGVSQLSAGLNQFSPGLTTYAGGVSQAAAGTNQLNQNSQSLVNGANLLNQGSGQVSQLATGTAQLEKGLTALATASSLTPEQTEQINLLIQNLPALNTAIQTYNSSLAASSTDVSSYLTAITTAAQTIINAGTPTDGGSTTTTTNTGVSPQETALTAVQGTAAYQSLSAEEQAEITNALAAVPTETSTTVTTTNTSAVSADVLTQAQAVLDNVASLQTSISPLQTAAQSNASVVNQLAQSSAVLLPAAASSLAQLSGGLNQASTALSTTVLPAASQLSTGSSSFSQAYAGGTAALLTGVTAYTNGLSQINSGVNQLASENSRLLTASSQLQTGASTLDSQSGQLVTGSEKLSSGASQLATGANQLAQGSNGLVTGLSRLGDGSQQLSTALSEADQRLSVVSTDSRNAQTLSNPVKLNHTDRDNVKTNGVGMAPYMMSAALMVMAISTNTIFRESLSGKKAKTMSAWVQQKLVVNGSIAVLGATILYFSVHLLGLQANFEGKTLLLTLLTSLTFMTLVTALVTWDKRFGAFAALILLLLQLGSSAGTYPVVLSSPIFQKLHTWLPMSYSVAGLRETISLSGSIGQDSLVLTAYLLLSMVLGFFIVKKQLENQA